MTENKFVAMMRAIENKHEHSARIWQSQSQDANCKYHKDIAADWRAMREAWEAMVRLFAEELPTVKTCKAAPELETALLASTELLRLGARTNVLFGIEIDNQIAANEAALGNK